MKLKKIVLAMLIVALVFMAAGCPMTAKEFKAENANVATAEYKDAVIARYDAILSGFAITLKYGDIAYSNIENQLKSANESSAKLSEVQKYYGVKPLKIVYTKAAEKQGLKKSDYTGKDEEQIVEALKSLFNIQ